MRNSRGRRFDSEEPKLNMKKVIATLVAILVFIMVVASIIMILIRENKKNIQAEELEYFLAYTNAKYTIINNKGEQLTNVVSDEIIKIPDNTKNIFIITYDSDHTNHTQKNKAVNEKNEQLFTEYEEVDAIVNYSSPTEVWYDKEVLSVKKDGKYGLIDFSGKEVLPTEYDKITALQGITKTVVLQKDGKYGLYNSATKTKFVDTKYTSIEALGESYNEGYILVDENNRYGLVGSEGKTILENRYDDISKVYGSDRYVVKEGGKTELIYKDGTVLLDSGFDDITSIDGDYLIVKNIGKYGVMNLEGKIIIDTAFDSMKSCFSNLYIVSTAGKYGVIDLDKNIKVEIKYSNIEYRNDIIALICENTDYTTDIYTRDLKYVFTGYITKVDTEKGYIRARVGADYKYYNLQYQEISNREALKGNTLFLIKEDGKYGYVNAEGKKIVDCIYDDAKEQNDYGYCAVNKDGQWGALQSNGAVVLEPSITLDNAINLDFIGTWHLGEDLSDVKAYVK